MLNRFEWSVEAGAPPGSRAPNGQQSEGSQRSPRWSLGPHLIAGVLVAGGGGVGLAVGVDLVHIPGNDVRLRLPL